MLRNSTTHYGAITRLLHWAMAAFIILSISAVELHELFPKGSAWRNGMMDLYFQIGLLVFLMIWVRIFMVATDTVPPIQPELQTIQALSAKLVKLVLYGSMIALPIIGIYMQQAADHTVALLGMQLPAFIDVDKEFAKTLRKVHETIGNVMIAMILLHTAAALWHHFKQKDNTLLRMLTPKQ